MHVNKHTHTQTKTLWQEQTLCHCCLFICQSGHPESPVLKSDCVSVRVCALSLLSVRYHWGGMLHRALHCLTYGFCSSALSRKQGQAGSLRMEPLGFMRFPSCPVVFNVSRLKLGYWWGSANGVTGPSAGSLCCVSVCCSTSVSTSGREGCHQESMWRTHFLWIAHLHAVASEPSLWWFPFLNLRT